MVKPCSFRYASKSLALDIAPDCSTMAQACEAFRPSGIVNLTHSGSAGAVVGSADGAVVGTGVGAGVGVAVGAGVGVDVGAGVGVGVAVGSMVGVAVGSMVGSAVGSTVGSAVGSAAGSVGTAVGAAVGGASVANVMPMDSAYATACSSVIPCTCALSLTSCISSSQALRTMPYTKKNTTVMASMPTPMPNVKLFLCIALPVLPQFQN